MNPQALAAESQAALSQLKDFQRATVDYVFARLFAPEGSRRFLVADEVGLGKTLIAKGVIAKGIEHLRGKVDRIDVVYICSNGDIARQNLNRLAMKGAQWVPASRLTLLAKQAADFKEVNFVAFTPGTSLEVNDGLGHVEERILLYQLIERDWQLGSGVAAMNVLAGQVDPKRFRSLVDTAAKLEGAHIESLRRQLAADTALRDELYALCDNYSTARSNPPLKIRQQRVRFVGKLRAALAKSCIELLQPDLIILDEFQRFSHLLEGTGEASELARALFEWKDAHVLLLSATPYKMYTAAHEGDAQQHYGEFLKTLRFLERRDVGDKSHIRLLERYGAAIEQVTEAGGEQRLEAARQALETRLHQVMVRTERLASTPDRNGMLRAVEPAANLQPGDVQDFLALQRVAEVVGRTECMVEYWKSGAFVLNFMDGAYQLKLDVNDAAEDASGRAALAKALSTSPTASLPFERYDAYEAIQLQNGRLRTLVKDTIGRGAQRLLWIPPACPYYGLGGAFADEAVKGFTKRLVFSSWRFAPRAIASLLSYEAERLMVGKTGEGLNTAEARKRRGRLLTFSRAEGGGPGAMSTLAMLYPSSFLARACDPLHLAAESRGESVAPQLADVMAAAVTQIELALRRLPAGSEGGPIDERWYWAAPLLLDAALEPAATRLWFDQSNLADIWSATSEEEEPTHGAEGQGESADGLWELHVERARSVAKSGLELGRRPPDLAMILAELALGAPGVVLLRSMLRVVNMRPDALSKESGKLVRNGAAEAAWSFRSLFNQPEVVDLLRREYPLQAVDAYWRSVLRYCVDGCLQSVLDEYTHVLRDHLGLTSGDAGGRVHEIAAEVTSSLLLRTANLAVDDLGLSQAGRTLKIKPRRMRCHFALRFGDERDDDGAIETRSNSVRKAFNSPFWPFVVATTSVGQEGLDFHTYCHAVVHWNLPSNPVDLEQREGRVHRFKGHAVRKNVAQAHFGEALASGAMDAWQAMFEIAERGRSNGTSDIVPYWVYTIAGGAQIERHVLAHALSKDLVRLHALLRSLTLYRMAFGQARQDDFVRYLQDRVPESDWARIAALAAIDISPAAQRDHATAVSGDP
ncbi:MAG: helicase-related protein [Polyangiaceae bacterium]